MTSQLLPYIASRLAGKPFRISSSRSSSDFISVFDLDEKSEADLLDILRSVISHLDGRFSTSLAPTVVRPQTPTTISIVKQTASYYASKAAIGDFFTLVECPLAHHLLRSKAELLALLHWLLSNFSDLGKKSRVIRFCARNELPDAVRLGQDRELSELLNQLEDLKASVKVVSIEIINLETRVEEFEKIKTKCQKISQDIYVLSEKIMKTRSKVANNAELELVLSKVKQMRIETQKFETLSEKEKSLNSEIDSLKSQLSSLCDQTGEITLLLSPGGAEAVRVQSEKNRRNLDVFRDDLARINAKRVELEVLKNEYGSATLVDLAKLELELEKMKRLESDLVEKMGEAQNNADTMALYYQQLRVAKQRFLQASTEAERVGKDHQRASLRHEKIVAESGQEVVSEKAFQELVQSVRQKGVEYKSLKRTVGELKAEIHVLDHTLQVLVLESGVTEKLDRPILPLSETHAKTLEINSFKESQLEEMSTVVKELMTKLSAKKIVLGPKLKELKSMQEIRNKLRADCLQSSLRAEKLLDGLSAQIVQAQVSIRELEGLLSQIGESMLNTEKKIKEADHQLIRADEEELYINGVARHSELYRTHFEALTAVFESRSTDCDMLSEKLSKSSPNECNRETMNGNFELVCRLLARRCDQISKFKNLKSVEHLIITPN